MSIRTFGIMITIWNKDARNTASIDYMRERLQELLMTSEEVRYQDHNGTIKQNEMKRKARVQPDGAQKHNNNNNNNNNNNQGDDQNKQRKKFKALDVAALGVAGAQAAVAEKPAVPCTPLLIHLFIFYLLLFRLCPLCPPCSLSQDSLLSFILL